MKHLREELWFNIPERRGYINITGKVRDLVTQSPGCSNGLCLVNAMHITASVYINDDESGLIQDYDDWLEKLAPFNASAPIPASGGYRHNQHGRGQCRRPPETPGHGPCRSSWPSPMASLDFGPWEQIFYAEFDGRRRKRVLVKIIGE